MAPPRDAEDHKAGAAEFEREAEMAPGSAIGEFLDFLLHNKKWWLAPIIVVLLAIGLIVMLNGTGVAPFIYALF